MLKHGYVLFVNAMTQLPLDKMWKDLVIQENGLVVIVTDGTIRYAPVLLWWTRTFRARWSNLSACQYLKRESLYSFQYIFIYDLPLLQVTLPINLTKVTQHKSLYSNFGLKNDLSPDYTIHIMKLLDKITVHRKS